jgi:hypothetical protein
MKREIFRCFGLVVTLLAQVVTVTASPAAMAFALPEGSEGTLYEFRIRTEGGLQPLRWSLLEGELPPGIHLDSSGMLKGVPTAARSQSYEFVLQVSDSSEPPQTSAQRFAVTIKPRPLRIVLGSTDKLTIVAPDARETRGNVARADPRSTARKPAAVDSDNSVAPLLISGPLKGDTKLVRGFVSVPAENVLVEVFSAPDGGSKSPAAKASRAAVANKTRNNRAPGSDEADREASEEEDSSQTETNRHTLVGRASVQGINATTGEFSVELSKKLEENQTVRLTAKGKGSSQSELIFSDEVKVGAAEPPPPSLKKPVLEGTNAVSGVATGKAKKVVVVVFNGDSPAEIKDTTDISTNGQFSVALEHSLVTGQFVKAMSFSDSDALPGPEDLTLSSPVSRSQPKLKPAGTTEPPPSAPASEPPDRATVEAVGDWGRARATFAFGAMFSKENGDFSKSDPYLNFNLDWNWFRRGKNEATNRSLRLGQPAPEGPFNFNYLFNTFFETRLTSIPKGDTKPPADSTPKTQADEPADMTASECPKGIDGIPCSKKAAVMQVGAYLPMFWNRWMTWNHNGDRNALFVAPIVKGGFQTVNTDEKNDGKNLLTFYSGGVRLGHYNLGKYSTLRDSANPALADGTTPQTVSYLDVTFGKWQNLLFHGKRQLRTAFEGRLKIPALPFQLGFDANIGRGADDLRFLIDSNFDVGNLFKKLLKSN